MPPDASEEYTPCRLTRHYLPIPLSEGAKVHSGADFGDPTGFREVSIAGVFDRKRLLFPLTSQELHFGNPESPG